MTIHFTVINGDIELNKTKQSLTSMSCSTVCLKLPSVSSACLFTCPSSSSPAATWPWRSWEQSTFTMSEKQWKAEYSQLSVQSTLCWETILYYKHLPPLKRTPKVGFLSFLSLLCVFVIRQTDLLNRKVETFLIHCCNVRLRELINFISSHSEKKYKPLKNNVQVRGSDIRMSLMNQS